MQKLKKILLVASIGLIFLNPVLVVAQTKSGSSFVGDTPKYSGVEDSLSTYLCTPTETGDDGHALENCVNKLYRFGISFGAIALVFFLVFAGYMYIVGGESGKQKAKGILENALIGIGLLLASYMILSFINPSLVVFKSIQPPIFDAATPPSCEEVGLGTNCVITRGPGDDVSIDPDKLPTGSYKACDKTFNDVAAAITTLQSVTVKVWNNSGGNKVTEEKSFKVQGCIAERTKKAFEAIYNNSSKPIIYSVGGFEPRNVSGTGKASAHAFGLAIDLNAKENCHAKGGVCSIPPAPTGFWRPCPGDNCSPNSFPANGVVVKAFKDNGFGWGGNWNSSKDYMHMSCGGSEGGKCNGSVANIDNTVAENLGYDDGDVMTDGIGYEKDYCDSSPSQTTAMNSIDSNPLRIGITTMIFNSVNAQTDDGSCRGYVDRSQCNKIYKSNSEVKGDLLPVSFTENDFYENYSWSGYLAGSEIYYKDYSGTIKLHKCVAYQAKRALDEYYAYTNNLIQTARHKIKPISAIAGQNWRNNSDGDISTHSFGLAIDIDSHANGNYKKGTGTIKNWTYLESGKWVIHAGGAWLPCHGLNMQGNYYLVSYNGTRNSLVRDVNKQNGTCNPYSISPNDPLVLIMRKYGFGWGGRWEGENGKGHLDFMHFGSYTGEYGNLYGPQ